jgi:hypothetical protein
VSGKRRSKHQQHIQKKRGKSFAAIVKCALHLKRKHTASPLAQEKVTFVREVCPILFSVAVFDVDLCGGIMKRISWSVRGDMGREGRVRTLKLPL